MSQRSDHPLPFEELSDRPVHGRGSMSNRSGRFEAERRVTLDDGWRATEDEDDEPSRIETRVERDTARSVITRNDSPDIGFDRSINPYRGCEHGCIYCYARPSHAYLGLSPGLDFETRLFAKHDAARLLEKELSRPGYRPSVIALGVNTDAYQPTEKRLGITRGVLEVLQRFRHPFGLVTKSALVLRDVDILAEMGRAGLAHVTVSITTLDRRLAREMEPRASTPPRRLAAIEGLARAGVPVSVNVAPIIPGLTDHEIESILGAARAVGAIGAGWTLLRLPREIKDLFGEWLSEHFPDRAGRILSLVRQTRGGALYDSEFRTRMRGTGPFAELIRQRFEMAAAKHGLARRWEPLDLGQFRAPGGGEESPQLSLEL